MSKVKASYSDEGNREQERAESRKKKEEETAARKKELKENRDRAESNEKLAQEALKNAAKKKQNSNLSYHIMFAVLGALCLYVIAMMFLNQAPPLNKVPVIDEKRIAEHNANSQWKQGGNDFFEGATLADAKKLMNTGFSNNQNLGKCPTDDSITVPDNFHYKDEFPNCVLPQMDTTKDCGASYGFTLAQTLAERVCIASKAEKSVPLSVQELIKCDILNNGCKNGHINVSLDHLKTKGVVEEECLPYKPEAEKCEGMCENPKRTKIDNYCLLMGEDDIKRDIMKNGPVVSTSHVFVDFLQYKSGVYTKGEDISRFSGQTAVRIVGWGVEDGSETMPNKGNKFWVVQPTWGKSWGEEGYAKVSFGQELFFDQYSYSLKPKVLAQRVTPPTATDNSADVNPNAGVVEEQNVNLDLDDVAQ